jgi:hypothetical protein
MTATLLAPSLSAQSVAILEGVVGDVQFLEPFPLLCAFICIHAGRLKTMVHRHSLAIILTQTKHLRCIWTIEGVDNKGAPFWIPRRAGDRKKTNVERIWRSRLDRTLRAPCWTGTPCPSGYRTVRLRTWFPSIGYLVKLCGDFGYTWGAAGAALSRGHAPWSHPHSDKRRNRCGGMDEIEREGNIDSGARRGYAPQYDSQEYIDPYHPYVPASPARRTKSGGGFTQLQAVEAIANHGWDTKTSYALFEIFFKGKSTKEAANERSLPIRTLYQYASIIRKDIQGAGGECA